MTMKEQREKEIATIKERTFKISLSDEDVKKLWEKAGKVGMTAGELLAAFVGDLVNGTYSNGSDERMYAEQWFDRCGFSYTADKTFLRYLLEYGELDSLLQSVDELDEYIEEKKSLEAELQENQILEDVEQQILSVQNEINEVWNGFLNWTDKKNCDQEAEIKAVQEWQSYLSICV